MARTTEALSFVAADVEVSQDGVIWTVMESHSTSIAVSGGDRRTGEVNVFDDERPIVKAGKKGSQVLTIRYVYTEETAGPFTVIRAWDDTEGGVIYARYWPAGRTAGNYVFETGEAIINSFLDPAGEAGTGEPVMGEVQITTEEISKSIWGATS